MSPRSLIVFRHGKSDWGADAEDDRSRPLAPRGRRSAEAMGRYLAGIGEVPDLALTSPARRAADTLRIAAAAGHWNCEQRVCAGLYGSVADALGELRRLPAAAAAAILVGHEPTSSELAALLMGGGRIRMPTGAMVRLELDVDDWGDLAPSCGQLAWLVTPRLIDGRPGRR